MCPFPFRRFRLSLSFSEASFILGLMANIAPEKAETFKSRLKQWQKRGFPAGTQVGKGVKAEYGATQIFQLILMVKLLKVGLTPERAQTVVETAWPAFRDGFAEALVCAANDEPHLHYFMIQLDALSELSDPGSDHMHIFVDIFTTDEMLWTWEPPVEDLTDDERRQYDFSSSLVKNRMALSITLEIDSILVWLWAALSAVKKTPDLFADDLVQWDEERRERGRVEQPDQIKINDDVFRRSVVFDGSFGVDRVESARLALKNVRHRDDGNS